MWCGRGRGRSFNKQQAIEEVAHLNRLSHAHIVRVVGTYVMGNQLSILLYPVADCNLEHFLEDMRTTETTETIKSVMFSSSKDFFGCLINATKYIHSNLVKHMDIKPQNVLVRRNTGHELHIYTVLVADFGIARSYDKPEATETDGSTSYTLMYAAPEVIDQEMRGLAADIFSLGCVFMELFITLCDTTSCIAVQKNAVLLQREAIFSQPQWTHLQSLLGCAKASPCSGVSYSMSIETLQKAYRAQINTLQLLPTSGSWLSTICDMISRNPKERPTAVQLEGVFGKLACCDRGPYALETYQEGPTTI
jgi:serine/threonine protein kinase